MRKCAVKPNALFNEQKMMNSDPLQCLIAVIVMDLKIMDRERARQGAMIVQQQDTVIISVWSAKYGPVHALFIYERQ